MNADILAMKVIAAVCLLSAAICLYGGTAALAQDPTAPLPNILPPPPPPPPPPSLAIPKIPKMDEIPTQQLAPRARRKSFDMQVQDCIHEGAAAGLDPNERAAYTRACVNSR
jgi:hypothetical protein